MFWYIQPAVCIHWDNRCKSCKNKAANILPNVISVEKNGMQSTYFNVNTISLPQYLIANSDHINKTSFNILKIIQFRKKQRSEHVWSLLQKTCGLFRSLHSWCFCTFDTVFQVRWPKLAHGPALVNKMLLSGILSPPPKRRSNGCPD